MGAGEQETVGGGLSHDIRKSQHWDIGRGGRWRGRGGGHTKKWPKGKKKKKNKEEEADCHRWAYRAWPGRLGMRAWCRLLNRRGARGSGGALSCGL